MAEKDIGQRTGRRIIGAGGAIGGIGEKARILGQGPVIGGAQVGRQRLPPFGGQIVQGGQRHPVAIGRSQMIRDARRDHRRGQRGKLAVDGSGHLVQRRIAIGRQRRVQRDARPCGKGQRARGCQRQCQTASEPAPDHRPARQRDRERIMPTMS